MRRFRILLVFATFLVLILGWGLSSSIRPAARSSVQTARPQSDSAPPSAVAAGIGEAPRALNEGSRGSHATGGAEATRAASSVIGPVIVAAGVAEGVREQEVLRLPWGRQGAAVGLYVPQDEEGLPIGPASFAVDDQGHVYIADTVNRRILVLAPHGTVDRILEVDANLADLSVDSAGQLHTLEHGTDLVRTLDPQSGRESAVVPLETLGVGELPVEGLVVRDGQVHVRRVDQTVRSLQGGEWEPDRVVTAWPQGGTASAETRSAGGEQAKRVAIEVDVEYVQGSVQFLGPDGRGGSYVLVETLSPDGGIESGVRRYDRDGRFLAAAAVPFRNLAQPARTFTVDGRGNLYQMVTNEEGVQVLRWDLRP